jgi:hypothetical protein
LDWKEFEHAKAKKERDGQIYIYINTSISISIMHWQGPIIIYRQALQLQPTSEINPSLYNV